MFSKLKQIQQMEVVVVVEEKFKFEKKNTFRNAHMNYNKILLLIFFKRLQLKYLTGRHASQLFAQFTGIDMALGSSRCCCCIRCRTITSFLMHKPV